MKKFVLAHWHWLLLAVVAGLSYSMGRWQRPAPVEHRAEARTDDKRAKVTDIAKDMEKDAAATRKIVLDFNPDCAATKSMTLRDLAAGAIIPTGIVRATIVDAGPVRVVERTQQEVKATEELHTQTIQLDKPLSSPPQWTIGAGMQLRPNTELRISLERRLFGPLWIGAWVQQPLTLALPSVGIGARVEF